MKMHDFPRVHLQRGLPAIACLLLAFPLAAIGQIYRGTSSMPSPGHPTAASYDSDPDFGSQSFGHDNTPEADARPGEYYFRIAAAAFRKKQYDYAIDMYTIAASWAYKPAEYNLGVMYFRGQGVPVDRPLGTAWMVLAAERDTEHYVAVRDLFVSLLDDAEFSKADALFGQLQPTYGDATALHKAEVRWAQTRAAMTGSHVGGVTGPLSIGAPGGTGRGGTAALVVNQNVRGTQLAGGRPSMNMLIGAQQSVNATVFQEDHLQGTIAYRQFRLSDNPYDVKFLNNSIGITSVGPLQVIKHKPDASPSDKSAEDTPHD
ncbi:sel1 repeat family protein [Rhodanobacter ginsengisoli]|uniref:Sel1 repeat family protein n=1 Tax=Rhodanobacter ginsengisoli TaxID=418646 RepID=A0ABW0QQU9_9GAMM